MDNNPIAPSTAELIALVLYLVVAIRDVEDRIKRLEEQQKRPVKLASATSMSL